MKKLSLLLLLAVSICYAQDFEQPNNIIICDTDGDNFASFDLTVNDSVILNGLNPEDYTITYHLTETSAMDGIPAIPNPMTFTNTIAEGELIYVRVVNNDTGNNVIMNFDLIINSIPPFEIPFGSFCEDFTTGEIIPYILDSGFTTDEYTFQWYFNSVIIEDATQATYAATTEGYYTVEVTNIVTGCTGSDSAIVIKSGPASPVNEGYVINGETITIMVNGFGTYQYSIDDSETQDSNVFNNIEAGTHTIIVSDETGCGSLILTLEIIPPAPDGQSSQTFTEDETLADIEVIGQNIQWYETAQDGTLLSMSTLLADGTTYFASQTINGVESEERLAVTVHLTMGIDEQSFSGLQYYPNPVTDILNIANTSILDSVSVYNMIGQTVINQKIDDTTAKLDFSMLNSGIYIVKMSSGGQSKTIKIQKN